VKPADIAEGYFDAEGNNVDRFITSCAAFGLHKSGYFAHTGFNSGFLALMMGSKTGGNGVVVMLNMAPQDMSGPVPQFSFLQALVRRVADEEGWN
jgi:hypothetical protein